jgi:hypothetical protein
MVVHEVVFTDTEKVRDTGFTYWKGKRPPRRPSVGEVWLDTRTSEYYVLVADDRWEKLR